MTSSDEIPYAVTAPNLVSVIYTSSPDSGYSIDRVISA